MLFLFTDFGWHGPYVGEMKAVLARAIGTIPAIDLMHDAPCFNPRASAYLLAALSRQFKPGDYCLAIVDPGVGDPERRPILLQADGVTYIGPDNGLFAVLATSARQLTCSEILWRPGELSASFHGRDLFAPVMAMQIAKQDYARRPLLNEAMVDYGRPAAIAEVIYIDGYGNCVTGLRNIDLATSAELFANNVQVRYARTFSMVEPGQAFWYFNSMGLAEIACNQGSAAARLGLTIGTEVGIR